MASLYILFLAFVSLCLCQTEIISLYRDNHSTRAVNQYASLSSAETTALRFALIDEHCINECIIGATSSDISVYEVAGRAEEDYLWKKIPSTKTSVDGITTLKFEKPVCGFIYKVELASSDSDRKIEDVTIVSSTVDTLSYRKRAEEQNTGSPCETPGNVDQCMTDPFGSHCLTTNVCGCLQDADCFTATNRPYCDTTAKSCVKCKFVNPATNSETTIAGVTPSQYFCRARFPSSYLLGESTPVPTSNADQFSVFDKGYPAAQESVASFIDVNSPTNYNAAGGNYREVCDTASTDSADGSCKPCFNAEVATLQASYATQFAAYKTAYTGTFGVPGGAMGTYHCSTIRPTDLPICSDQYYWKAAGLESVFTTGSVNLKGINLNNYKYGGGEGISSPFNFRGACLPCRVTDINRHSLCALGLTTTPVCTDDGTCRKCSSNADCVQTADCQSTGTCKSYTGVTPSTGTTLNCQADGSCKKCTSNADCGALDGGETASQPTCDVATGLCEVPFKCTKNSDCTAKFGAASPNCNKDGTCISCSGNNANCGATDGGEVSDQTICDATGVCRACTNNADCPGSNCQANGNCLACAVSHTSSTCNTLDGGEVPNQINCNLASRQCTAKCTQDSDCAGTQGANCMFNGICLDCRFDADCAASAAWGGDISGDTLCDTNSKLCTPACKRNADCPAATPNCNTNGRCSMCKTNADCGVTDGGEVAGQTICFAPTGICETACTTNQVCKDNHPTLPNCNKDGTCISCKTNADCGATDGGETNNQPVCETLAPNAGQCRNCGVNSDCGLQNCQADGSCLACSVSHTSSTCSTVDGGEISKQINCDLASRQCVAACSKDGDCAGTQGANCMSSGLCLDCRSDADCGNGNAWNGDITGASLCDPTTKLCFAACTQNSECPANQNCQKDGRCRACTSNQDCIDNDGPPVKGTNTVCKSGVCIDPYFCVADNSDNANCKLNTGDANCQKDRSCKTCKSNADCGALDGGVVPDQPRCNTITGVCGPCLVNADCPSTAPNCGKNGFCYACTDLTCGSVDGGEKPDQPNCGLDGICTNICVKDSQCTDACLPHCNVDKGCCVECTTNSHCPLSIWINDARKNTVCSSDDTCIPPESVDATIVCEVDSDCTGSNKACLATSNACVQCTLNQHCSGATPACDVRKNQCVGCLQDSDCNGKACDISTRTCVECLTDWECTTAGKPACDAAARVCVACTSNEHCGGATPACDVSARMCVQCRDDGDCPGGACDTSSNTCVECVHDGHCAGTFPACDAARGSCVRCMHDGHCIGTNIACKYSTRECVRCTGDHHCPADAPACDVGRSACVECMRDTHCDQSVAPHVCGNDLTCHQVDSASTLGFGLFLVVLTFLMHM